MSQNIFTHTKTSPVFMVGNITSTDDILNDREANETLNKYKKFNAVELTIPPLGLEAKVNDNGEYVMVEENGKKRPDYLPGHKYRSCFSLFSKSHGVGAENMYQPSGTTVFRQRVSTVVPFKASMAALLSSLSASVG